MEEFLSEIWKVDKLYILQDTILETSSQIAAVILIVDMENIDRIIALKAFDEILKSLNLETSLFGIQTAQVGVINSIINLKISRLETLNYIKILENEKIISHKKYTQLFEFLNSLKLIKEDITTKNIRQNLNFYQNLQELNLISDELCKFDKNAQNAKTKANNSKFIISVTGVINSGKSSMLNSFLQKDILGTSNIPETANLSLLRYGDEESAKVIFYNQDELKRFNVDKRYEDKIINIEELKNYTSAKYEISKFIKMVELNLKLPILKDNISIVDTPGLDDTIELREELTRYFMQKSDAIIHLMNASQSATKKDISFIVDTLKNSKNSSLIVVLTHCDLLEESELVDVVNYTQKSIKEELVRYEFDKNLVDEVRYFSIDNKSKKGIDELKSYIYNLLFGKNSKKAMLVLNSYKKELNLITLNLINELKLKLSNLSKDDITLQNDNKNLKKEIKSLQNEISEARKEIDRYFSKLNYDDIKVDLKFKSAFLKIKDSIILDLKYNESRNKKIDYNRIKIISQSRLQDIMVDTFRDIVFQISKEIEIIRSNLRDKFELNSEFEFGYMQFLEENFSQNDKDKFSNDILKIAEKKTSLEQKASLLEELFDDYFKKFDLKILVSKIGKLYTANFKKELDESFENFIDELLKKQKILEENLLNKTQNLKNSGQELYKLKDDLDELTLLYERLNNDK